MKREVYFRQLLFLIFAEAVRDIFAVYNENLHQVLNLEDKFHHKRPH